MSIKVSQGFKRTGAFPLDESMMLTSAEMAAVLDSEMPAVYLALNTDDGKLYIYNKSNTPSAETGKFAVLEGGSGGLIGENFTTNIAVGGLASGTDIVATDSIASILKRMLVTVYLPEYTAPSSALTFTTPTLVKVGSSIAGGTAIVSFDAGAITVNGVKQADRAGAATGYAIATSGADADVSDSNDTGSFTIPALTRSTKGIVTMIGTTTYAEGPQPKDSDGKDVDTPLAAGSVDTAAKRIEFIQAMYYGASANPVITDFAGLTEVVEKKGNKTFEFTTTVSHVVFAYDAAYGDLKTINDQNGFDVTDGFTKSTVTVDGFEYFVYVQDNATTDTNAAYTFKF